MDVYFSRLSLGLPLLTCVLVIADEFLFLGIHRNYWTMPLLESSHGIRNVLKLFVPVWMSATFGSLAVTL